MSAAARPRLAPAPRLRGAEFARDVLAVIVLYGRDLADSDTFRTLTRALERSDARLRVLVYDNSPVTSAIPADASERWDVQHVADPSNPGVSAAYVAGARLAERLGKRWLLFFDQDTRVPADAFEAYADAVARYPREVLFAPVLFAGGVPVSPCAYGRFRGRALDHVAPGPRSLVGTSVLNSGMCIDRATYAAAGGHDRAIPLDFSDHDLVARVRRLHPTFAVVDAEFAHGLSSHEAQPVGERVRRFAAYCRGALRVSRTPGRRAAAWAFLLARAAVLAWRWRAPAFLAVPAEVLRDRGHG